MKIKHLKIENFRAISRFDEEIGSYTAFIGYNGSGKSSILHAVKWFFEDYDLTTSDVFSENYDEPDLATLPEVKVTVTFDSITDQDRKSFGPYAQGKELVLTRVGGAETSSKLYGERLSCADFEKVRRQKYVNDMREQLEQIINEDERFKDLSSVINASRDQICKALDSWESNPKNFKHLTPINHEIANHFFGTVGTNKLGICSGFVFIPAAPDLTGQFNISEKGSALQVLLGDILKGVVNKSIDEWSERNRNVLQELESTVKEVATSGLEDRKKRVNAHLQNYLPGVTIDFEVGLQDWSPKATPNARSMMRQGDREFLIERHGHGVQRATLLALLQATAESRAEPQPADGSFDDPQEPLIVFIEEPEVYQHPVQARMMARSFAKAAGKRNIQFVLATHSPYFLDPAQIQNTFRVENSRDGSVVHRPSAKERLKENNHRGELDKYFLESVTESLFSRVALVVEGDTERAIFDTAPCDDEGRTLRDWGVSVAVAGGASSLLDMAQLIEAFGVPTIVVRDGDSDPNVALETAKRKTRNTIKKKFGCEPDFENERHLQVVRDKQEELLASWKSSVNKFIADAGEANLATGLEKFEWGEGLCVGESVVILRHDLESELHEWSSFVEASQDFDLDEDFRLTKKAGIFARVAAKSNWNDMPKDLQKILTATVNLAKRPVANDCRSLPHSILE